MGDQPFPESVINMGQNTQELSLAHVSGSVIERTYMRSDLLDLRRELMEAWANYVTGEVHG